MCKLNLIETLKIYIYNLTHTQNTKLHFHFFIISSKNTFFEEEKRTFGNTKSMINFMALIIYTLLNNIYGLGATRRYRSL